MQVADIDANNALFYSPDSASTGKKKPPEKSTLLIICRKYCANHYFIYRAPLIILNRQSRKGAVEPVFLLRLGTLTGSILSRRKNTA
jgi:hypothetical protein